MVLTREYAQQQLKEAQLTNWSELCLTSIESTLPAHLRSSAYALLNLDEQGKVFQSQTNHYEETKQYNKELERRLQQLAEMTSEERLAIFTALVPRLATAFEASWQLLGRLPYQQSTYRRAFRAPGHKQAYTEKRLSWLRTMFALVTSYREKDLAWFANWAPHLAAYNTQQFGILFAAAIDEGDVAGEEILELLMATARGEQEIGAMGRHVTTGLLAAGREEGWDCMERLLLAAQREEGLRQVILETVDEAHPQAFRRMVRLILEHDLLRFSATVRAADVWFGFAREVEDVADLRLALRTVLPLLDNPVLRDKTLAQGNPQEVYLALWAIAFVDASSAITAALPLLSDALPERRLAAAHLLSLLNIPETQSLLLNCLADPDLRVALHAFGSISVDEKQNDLFEHIQALLERLQGKSQSLHSGIWPWLQIQAAPDGLLQTMLVCLGERDPHCMIGYLPSMNPWTRIQLAQKLAKLPEWDAEVRAVLYQLLGERTQWMSSQALALIAARPVDEADTAGLEQLLTRKGVELRSGLITLLLKREDEAVLESAGRLLDQGHALQRLAGLDLVNGLVLQQRQVERALALARAYAERRVTTPPESVLLETIFAANQTLETLKPEHVLGLITPEQRTPVVAPRKLTVTIDTPATRACLLALNALIEEQSTTPVLIKTWRGHEEMLLGNTAGSFPGPDLRLTVDEDEHSNLPMAELWLKWERERPATLRDEDGLELFRATLFLQNTLAAPTALITDDQPGYRSPLATFLAEIHQMQEHKRDAATPGPEPETLHLRYRHLINTLLTWLQRRQGMAVTTLNFLLDTAEAALASVEAAAVLALEKDETLPEWQRDHARSQLLADRSLTLLREYHTWHSDQWEPEQRKRRWQLLHWLDTPAPGLERFRPDLGVLMEAWSIGEANEADIFDQLAGPRTPQWGSYFPELQTLSTRTPAPEIEKYPVLARLMAELRMRILEIELRRGEMPTPATALALTLRHSGGTATFVRLVALLAPTDLVRGYTRGNQGKGATWSHLLRVSFPGPDETLEEFARQAREAHLSTERLVAAALYAPQWVRQIEYVLGWPHFTAAVWWIYAHTKGNHWSVDEDIRKMWQSQVAEQTMVSPEELLEGAVDVAWFKNSYNELGAERWEQVYSAAKYASDGAGHGRARLYADAMLGKVRTPDLRQRLFEKRQPDVARALGLTPLPSAEQERKAEIAERYEVFQEFKRAGRKFGSQRRASEETAIRIGMENLARTAGFPDPQRLQWAMEAQSMPDLRAGFLELRVEEVALRLELDDLSAEPRLVVTGDKGKQLKTLPTRLKKHQDVLSLLERKRAVEQQISRMRPTLEAAMCRGDRFTAREILELLVHPVLSRLLRNLVFLTSFDEAGEEAAVYGYPLRVEGAGEPQLLLRDYTGQQTSIATTATNLRLAHPHDLFAHKTWHEWQHECFATGRTQPFKQVFRELYICTSNEIRHGDDALSQRYHGHQVQPRQSQALLGQRGWVIDYEEGVRRTFHAEKLTAILTFTYGGFTPSEVEGQTVGDVFFLQRGEYKPIPLVSVPPRVFSETMRDLDLMVSVAHSGGVDPEATASTVEMRSTLVSETCELLGITNVTLKSSHALIAGARGHYSVHLGSAVVHRQPGGALCIIPVHAQHRGRIFLPFADNDPKTAEVITKVITLARDHEIKDPTILEQLA